MASPTDRTIEKSPPITVPRWTDEATPRRIHRFRQSSLNDLAECSERGRRVMSGIMPSNDNEANTMGTACHAAFENAIEAQLAGTWLALEELQQIAQDEFTVLSAAPGFAYVDLKEGGARAFIDKAVEAWVTQVWETLNPVATELSFGPLVIHEDDQRIIEVTGSIDYLDATGLMDWKTASRKYERWEKARWAVQPTVYCLAAQLAGIIPERERQTFEYVVLLRGRNVEVQRIVVERHAGHYAWLVEKCLSIATLIEASLPEWPKNDQHALCSQKWCPAWAACKGKHFADGWPQVDEPA